MKIKGKHIYLKFILVIALLYLSVTTGCDSEDLSLNIELMEEYRTSAKTEINIYAESKIYGTDNDLIYIIDLVSMKQKEIDKAISRNDIDNIVIETKELIDMYISKQSEDKTLDFVEKSLGGWFIDDEKETLLILHSYRELEQYIEGKNIKWENESILDRYDNNYFNKKSLVLCFYWGTDARIHRYIESIKLKGGNLNVYVMCDVPNEVSDENGNWELNDDSVFLTSIVEVASNFVADVETIILSFQYQLGMNQK